MNRRRLLYLGFAFPPGVQAAFPGINATGHIFETQLIGALSQHFEIRSVGFLPMRVEGLSVDTAASPGLDHALVLLDKQPEALSRWKSHQQLKRSFLDWRRAGWCPDVVVFYNLSPAFARFIRWLGSQPGAPRRIVLLADSNRLGCPMPALRRLRHRLKFWTVPEETFLRDVEGCVSLSKSTGRFFRPHKIPWLWMPGGCNAQRAVFGTISPTSGPIRVGYFGRLAADPGVPQLLEAFSNSQVGIELHICGYGNLVEDVKRLAQSEPRLHFHGPAGTADGYLQFAQDCDVLANPRPRSPSNENNFPSKLFAYALTGKAILTTGFAGAADVLGPEAFYLNEADLIGSIRNQFTRLAAEPREELRRRGKAIQQRVLADYSWPQQAEAITSFIEQLLTSRLHATRPAA